MVFQVSLLDAQRGEQASKFTCAAGKSTWRDLPILVCQTDGWQLLSELVQRTDRILVIG